MEHGFADEYATNSSAGRVVGQSFAASSTSASGTSSSAGTGPVAAAAVFGTLFVGTALFALSQRRQIQELQAIKSGRLLDEASEDYAAASTP